tara:strand:+ start:80 stop:517 length:438 start_codon:yes stop_codon:yes gene_type:complete
MAYFGDGSNLSGVSGIPSGFIGMWYGATNAIPSGWVLCDGQNSTPDLRDKFVVGASDTTGDTSYPGLSPDATGGQADAIVPNHTHPTSVDSGRLFHQGGQGNTVSYGGAGSYPGTVFSMQDPSNGETVTNKNLPPYYALAYIMKT